MKLTRVELRDYRCFGKADFDLTRPGGQEPSDVVLLVGENGSGKSSFLRAVAGFFGRLVPAYDADPLTGEDIREGAKTLRIGVGWRDSVGGSEMAYSFWRGVKTTETGKLVWDDDPHNWQEAHRWSDFATGPGASGLVLAFDVYRLLPPRAVAGPNTREVVDHRCKGSLAPTLRREGRLEPRFGQLKQWIVNIDFLRAKAKADRGEALQVWDSLRDALNLILTPITFEGVDESFEVLFRTPTGLVRLESLSDGFRSIFVVVTDLLLRSSLSASRPEEILRQEAVCMIDEIEAHLHPRMQERVIPGLRRLFPNVQFIATTHSPIVVSSVEPHQVFRLDEEV